MKWGIKRDFWMWWEVYQRLWGRYHSPFYAVDGAYSILTWWFSMVRHAPQPRHKRMTIFTHQFDPRITKLKVQTKRKFYSSREQNKLHFKTYFFDAFLRRKDNELLHCWRTQVLLSISPFKFKQNWEHWSPCQDDKFFFTSEDSIQIQVG